MDEIFKMITEEEWAKIDYDDGVKNARETLKGKELQEELTFLKQQYNEIVKKDLQDLSKDMEKRIDDSFDFMEACEKILKTYPMYYDKAGIWWMFLNNKWNLIDEIDIMKMLAESLKMNNLLKSQNYVTFFRALKIEARKKEPKVLEKDWIQFKDEVFNYITKEKRKLTSGEFITNPINYKLGEDRPTPFIDKLINDWVGKDKLETILDIFSYCLLRDYPIQRIIVFLGSGSNGKGSFLRLLRKIIGVENSCSTDLEKINMNRFETANLYNTLVCEIAETNITNMKQTSTLKRLTGGDLITAEFKGKNSFKFINYSKLIIASNSLPMTFDKTDGFYRRWLIIDFPNKFEDGKEITDSLTEEELSNFCYKIANRLPELLERRKFTNEGSIEDRKKRYEEKSNPLKTYLDLFCCFDSSGFIPKWKFNEAFIGFLHDRGYRDWNSHEINRGLRSLGIDMSKKVLSEGGNPIWCVLGLQFKGLCVEKEGLDKFINN